MEMASPVSAAAASAGGSSVSSLSPAAASPTNTNSVTITTTASVTPTASVSSPTSASSSAGLPPALSSSCRGVYLDVLRSAARLTLQHGAELKEEVRGIMRQTGKGGRRGPQQAQEPSSSLALLSDLQALVSGGTTLFRPCSSAVDKAASSMHQACFPAAFASMEIFSFCGVVCEGGGQSFPCYSRCCFESAFTSY